MCLYLHMTPLVHSPRCECQKEVPLCAEPVESGPGKPSAQRAMPMRMAYRLGTRGGHAAQGAVLAVQFAGLQASLHIARLCSVHEVLPHTARGPPAVSNGASHGAGPGVRLLQVGRRWHWRWRRWRVASQVRAVQSMALQALPQPAGSDLMRGLPGAACDGFAIAAVVLARVLARRA